jgi:hypothetical protein
MCDCKILFFLINCSNGKHKTYSIVTAYEKLSEKYPVKCLSIYEGNVKINNEKTLSLHAAAALASRHTVDSAVVKSKCECKTGCKTNSCPHCKKSVLNLHNLVLFWP